MTHGSSFYFDFIWLSRNVLQQPMDKAIPGAFGSASCRAAKVVHFDQTYPRHASLL
jgi:hypothetical protein